MELKSATFTVEPLRIEVPSTTSGNLAGSLPLITPTLQLIVPDDLNRWFGFTPKVLGGRVFQFDADKGTYLAAGPLSLSSSFTFLLRFRRPATADASYSPLLTCHTTQRSAYSSTQSNGYEFGAQSLYVAFNAFNLYFDIGSDDASGVTSSFFQFPVPNDVSLSLHSHGQRTVV